MRIEAATLALMVFFGTLANAAPVDPPNAGTPDNQIPASYTRAGVKNLRITSNKGRDRNDNELTATVWRWEDRNGATYRLTRRLVSRNNGAVGSLGDFDLEVTPARKPAPIDNGGKGGNAGGKMQLPPKGMSDEKIPGFYSPRGVNDLTMASSISTGANNAEITEMVWNWKDDNGKSYKLTRVRTKAGRGTSDRYAISING